MNHIVGTLLVLGLLCGGESLAGDEDWWSQLYHSDSLARAGQPEQAVEFGHRLVQRIEAVPGTSVSVHAAAYQRLGNYFYMLGIYDSSAYYTTWALHLVERATPEDPILTASILTNLANLHSETGSYRRAKTYYDRALAIRRQQPDSSLPAVAYLLDRYALLYRRLGNLERAEELLLEALELFESVPEPSAEHLGYAKHNLANLYRAQGRLSEAEALLLESLDLQKQGLGPTHWEVASTLNDLANTYLAKERFAAADSVQRLAIEATRQALGDRHPWVAFATRDLARVYKARGDYPAALTEYRRSYYLLENVIGARHPQSAVILTEMAMVLRLVGEEAQAVSIAHQAYRIRRDLFDETAASLRERDALLYAHHLRASVDAYLSAALDARHVEGTELQLLAGVILSTKGYVSDGIYSRQRSWVTEPDSATQQLAARLRHARDRLARHYVRGYGATRVHYRDTLTLLIDEVHRLEQELIDRSTSYRTHRALFDADARRLVARMPPGSVLIEYLKFNYLPAGEETSVPTYVALRLNADGVARFSRLGAAAEIEQTIDRYRTHMARMAGSAGLPGPLEQEEFQTIARQLHTQVWFPLEANLKSATAVYVAPDAGLSLIAFETLIDDRNSYLVESAPLHYLSAGRDLIRVEPDSISGHGLLALGAPDYDHRAGIDTVTTPPATDSAEDYSYRDSARLMPSCEYFRDLDIPALPLSRFEVSEVARAWKQAFSEGATVLIGAQATETEFKRRAPGRRAIHLATHGYFLSEACGHSPEPVLDDRFVSDHPLLLSGLFLAGANRRLAADESESVDEGVLTAYEISALDLTGVEVVVLSACESGLGSVEEGEGVYGLRRAFQMAGARTVISSLWAVSDRETALFMSRLYQETKGSLSVRIREIQREEIANLRSEGLPDHPVSWGAFIASGAGQ